MEESNDYPSPSFRLVAIVALCVGIGAGAWAFFALIIPSISDDGKTVFIQADKSPIKTPPDQPGGMEIPHQDKLVFNAVTPGAKLAADHLAPPPEQPLFAQPSPATAVQQGPAVATPSMAVPSTTSTPAPVAVSVALPQAAPMPAQQQPAAGLTDAPGPMPVALGRAIGLPGGPAPAHAAATQAVKAEPATSFDYGNGGQPVLPPAAGSVADAKKPAPVTAPKAVQTKKLIAENEAFANDPASNGNTADEPGAAIEEKPILPPAHAVPTSDDKNTVADDSDDSDDMSAEDASPKPAKKPIPSAAVSKPKDEPAPFKPSASGSTLYQLASYMDKASAQRAVGVFKSKYADALSHSSLTIVSAMAKGHPVFRIQGSAASKDEASAICGRVKAKGGSCVIAR